MKLSMPFIVGSDFSGIVEAVGEGVTQWKIGDRVWGANQGGTEDRVLLLKWRVLIRNGWMQLLKE